MIKDLNTEFFRKVLDEVADAEAKHQNFPDDKTHGSAIVNEEAGKLTQASIDWECNNIPDEEAMRRMKKYALRVAAMALCFYESCE